MRKKNKAQRRQARSARLFVLLAVLLFFALAEGIIRIVGFRFEPFLDASAWWGRFTGNPIYLPDPLLFWRLEPNANADLDPQSRDTHKINSMGFRDQEFEKTKSPGEFRVIALGDSCTFGDGVADWETYTTVLERRLRENHPDRKFSVINAGVPGYTSYQALAYLENELLALKPDVVTVYVGLNDNTPASNSIPDANRAPQYRKLYTSYRFLRNLRTVQLVEYLVGRYLRPIRPQTTSPDEGYQTFRVPFNDYIANLCRIKELGDEHGFRVIVFTLPHTFSYESERNPRVRTAASQCAIPLLDLWLLMKERQNQGENLYEPDGGHPNTLGHQRIAEFLYLKLADLRLVPPPKVPHEPPRIQEAISPDATAP